jgi:hypothetical protein
MDFCLIQVNLFFCLVLFLFSNKPFRWLNVEILHEH